MLRNFMEEEMGALVFPLRVEVGRAAWDLGEAGSKTDPGRGMLGGPWAAPRVLGRVLGYPR